MADELRALQQLEAELTEMALAAQREAELLEAAHAEENSSASTRSYPSEYISTSSPEYLQLRSLWSRFHSWISRENASEHLIMNPSPAPPHKVFSIQEEFAQGDDLFSLPPDLLASFACHDGQDWSSTTGVIGRWYLLDCQTMFTEWRDQKEMMEMGLYSAPKYTQALKRQPKHSRIDTSYWFNPRWIPIACSRGSNLGGDLICIDLAPNLSRDAGQVILYMTESPERIVLADSYAAWLEKIVGHLEQGVYRFDHQRRTYAAGVHQEESKESDEEEKEQEEAATSSSPTSNVSPTSSTTPSTSPTAALSSPSPLPTSASLTIGVEAFMYSSLESRDFFILNQTEALVYLSENDFGFLETDSFNANQP